MRHLLICPVLLLILVSMAPAQELLRQADEIYNLRAVGFDENTLLADSNIIDSAIILYQKAVDNSTGSDKEEALWKLIRAYYFKGTYTTNEKDRKKEIFEAGRDVGLQGVELFPESAPIHLWVAIMWGVWAETHGIMSAARKGVANKMRRHCEKVIELDETFNGAGGYRIYGRLHFKSPKIPLILGWPSKKKAIELLNKAYQIDPRNLYTRQYLAEALYDQKRPDYAIRLMNEILDTDVIIHGLVEDSMIKSQVRETLNRWRKRRRSD
jgi:tetratricopeptide (TPR) repeat protein